MIALQVTGHKTLNHRLPCDVNFADIGIDTYDKDHLVYKYYSRPADAGIVAKVLPADVKEIKKLFKIKKLLSCNIFIATKTVNQLIPYYHVRY